MLSRPREDKIAVLAFGCELQLTAKGEWEGFRLLRPLSSPTLEGVAALEAPCIPRRPDHHVDLPQALYLCQKIFKEQVRVLCKVSTVKHFKPTPSNS